MSRLALTCVTDPAHPQLGKAVAEFGPVDVWEQLPQLNTTLARRARAVRPEAVAVECQRLGIRFVIPGDADWPPQLAVLEHSEMVNQFHGVPFGLFVRGVGELAEVSRQSVALVGARAATRYGEQLAFELAQDLSTSGFTVISGGAVGIDAAAHRGALSGPSPTIAALANGLNRCYPATNDPLFEHILERGLLISEFPPGEHPTRSRFLGRNRLIAALSLGTVVVEGSVRSGARNTANWVAAQRGICMATPGSVFSAMSYLPHQLVRSGEAVLVSNAAEVRELISRHPQLPPPPNPEHRPTDGLSGAELAIFEALPARGSRTPDELAARTGLTIPACLAALSALETRSLVQSNPNSSFQLSRGTK